MNNDIQIGDLVYYVSCVTVIGIVYGIYNNIFDVECCDIYWIKKPKYVFLGSRKENLRKIQ